MNILKKKNKTEFKGGVPVDKYFKMQQKMIIKLGELSEFKNEIIEELISIIKNLNTRLSALEKAESIESDIETLTGNYPEKVEENCDSTWFKADGKWYFIMIEKCAENAMEGKENKDESNV